MGSKRGLFYTPPPVKVGGGGAVDVPAWWSLLAMQLADCREALGALAKTDDEARTVDGFLKLTIRDLNREARRARKQGGVYTEEGGTAPLPMGDVS